MLVNYKILKDKNLLIQQYVGDFSIKDYVSYVYKVKKHPELKHVKYILTDIRDVKRIFTKDGEDSAKTIKKMEWLIKLRNHIMKNKNKYKSAFLISNSENTVAIHLYQKGEDAKNITSTYCTTLDAALEFLELTEDKDEIVSELNKFLV